MLAFGDVQNVDVCEQDLEASEKVIYEDTLANLCKIRRCSVCGERFRLSHNLGRVKHANEYAELRDHVDYQTEDISSWPSLKITRRMLQCLHSKGMLAHVELPPPDTETTEIPRVLKTTSIKAAKIQ